MAKRGKSTKELQAEMARIQTALRQAEEAQEAAFGKMARKAGVFDLDVDDAKMKEALNDLVERFRGGSTNGSQAKTHGPDTASQKADQTAGTGRATDDGQQGSGAST